MGCGPYREIIGRERSIQLGNMVEAQYNSAASRISRKKKQEKKRKGKRFRFKVVDKYASSKRGKKEAQERDKTLELPPETNPILDMNSPPPISTKQDLKPPSLPKMTPEAKESRKVNVRIKNDHPSEKERGEKTNEKERGEKTNETGSKGTEVSDLDSIQAVQYQGQTRASSVGTFGKPPLQDAADIHYPSKDAKLVETEQIVGTGSQSSRTITAPNSNVNSSNVKYFKRESASTAVDSSGMVRIAPLVNLNQLEEDSAEMMNISSSSGEDSICEKNIEDILQKRELMARNPFGDSTFDFKRPQDEEGMDEDENEEEYGKRDNICKVEEEKRNNQGTFVRTGNFFERERSESIHLLIPSIDNINPFSRSASDTENNFHDVREVQDIDDVKVRHPFSRSNSDIAVVNSNTREHVHNSARPLVVSGTSRFTPLTPISIRGNTFMSQGSSRATCGTMLVHHIRNSDRRSVRSPRVGV